MMRRLSLLALVWIAAILTAGFPTSLYAQATNQPLIAFDIGASPNPVGDGFYTTLTAFVYGTYGTPDGNVDFYFSSNSVTCSADNFDIGTVPVGTNGIATLNYFAGSSGTFPICANYIPGPSGVYVASQAGVFLLGVNQPTIFTVSVPAAGLQGTPLTFTFGVTTPSGQVPPTGTITLEDPNLDYTTIGTATVANGVVSNTVTTALAGNSYYAVYSGDSNYESQTVYGQVLIENGLSAINPAAVTAGSSDTNFTLTGLGFTANSQVELLIAGAQVTLPVNSFTATQIQTTIPATYLQNAGELSVEVITGSVTGGPVQVQVYAPYTVSPTDSANPSTFPYGSTFASTFGATVARGSTSDAAVPSGQVNFTLSGNGSSVSLGTAQLSQVSTQGTYLSPFTEPMDNYGTAKLISADLNGDGYSDVVGLPGTNYGGGAQSPYLQVMLSTGANALQTEQQVYTGCEAQDFAVGDISGDGIPDLVVVCTSSGYASSAVSNLLAFYMLGNGDGTFQQPVAFGGNSFIGSPTNVVLGQFNGDGFLDIAVIDGVAGNVQVLSPFGNPNSPYGPEVGFDTSNGHVVSAGAVDLNQDGLSDIALEEYSNFGYGAVLALISQGNGNGFYLRSESSFNATTQFMQSMTITDVNGDGYPDVAIADPGEGDSNDGGNILIFENDEQGDLYETFDYAATSAGAVAGAPFPVIGQPAQGAAAAPGWNLIYTSIGSDFNLWVTELQRQNATSWTVVNTFDTFVSPIYIGDSGPGPDFIVTGDMNGDGYLDFALNGSTDSIGYELQPWYYSNDAQASLTGASQIPTPGNYTLNLSFPGNQLYQSDSSANTPITITQATPTGNVTGPGTVSYGSNVTLTATVVGVSGGIAPTGNVTFYDGSNALQTVGLSPGSGYSTASMQTAQLPAGLHTITISYGGDVNYFLVNPLASTPVQVNASAISLSLTSSTSSTTSGTVVTFQVQSGGAVLPIGQTITLTGLPTAAPVTATLNGGGFASYSYGLFPPGSYTIAASFAGNASFGPATSNTASLQVSAAPVSVSLTSSANPVTYPTAINLSASVTSGGLGVPTGSISFQNNGSEVGNGTLATVNGSSGLTSAGTFDSITGQTVIAVVTGDFNKDGNQDIAALETGSGAATLLISLGNGDGTFQAPVSYSSTSFGIDPTSVAMAAADFNGDGYTDLVVAAADGYIVVLLAKGDVAGDLVFSQEIGVSGPLAVATGDFNHDGNQDFAVISSNSIAAFYGSSQGSFPTEASWSTSFDTASFTGISVADLNKDGYADIAISDNAGPDVAVFLYNTESGGFSGPQTYSVGVSASAVAAGDINGDGYPDLAVVSNLDSTVNVLINNGTDGAGTFASGTSYGVASQPAAVTINDFNQDGYADVAVAGTGTGQGGGTTILLGSSSGAMTGETALAAAYGQSIASADFNGDGNPDLAVGYNGVAEFVDSAAQVGVSNITLTAGTAPLTAVYTPSDSSNFAGSTSATVNEVVNQAVSTIAWSNPAGITYGTALSGTQLNTTSSVPGTFTYTPAAGTILSAGMQELTVSFVPNDTVDYLGATASVQITVSQAASTVTWSNPAAITYGTALSATQLNATSSVPGTFTYTPDLGTILTAGLQTLKVSFTPTDATDYAASTGTVQIQVNQATPVISWSTPAAITYGTKLGASQLNASASTTGTLTYTPVAGTLLGAGTQTLKVSFAPTDIVDYTTATGSVQIQVNQATPVITWTHPAAITYGTTLSATQLDATATPTGGTFTYTPPVGTTLPAGAQMLRVNYVPTDTTNYTSVSASVPITVSHAATTVTWSTPAAITYGTALSSTQLNATASVPGTFTYTPALGTILTAGLQTLQVSFTPTDTADYTASTGSVQIEVNQATPVISWNTPAAITYGTKLGASQLNATASTAGALSYSPVAGTVLGAGTQTLKVSFTPTDTVDYTAATGSVQIQVNQATPVITWANPAAITYGTTLSATQLDATATPTGGTFTYTPPLGTTLTVGTQTLHVSYVPKDTADYTGATAQVQITVNQASTTVTWSTPAAITYGTALSAAQLNATSPVPGTFTYTPAAGAILPAGPQTLKVSFTPTDTTDYAASTGTVQIQVNQATPVISWSTPAAIAYGTKLSASQLNATASTAGTLTYTPVAGTVLGAGTQTLKVSFAPTDAVDYTASTGTVQIQVNQATPVISWNTPAAVTYGTKLSASQLNATASTAGALTYTPVAGTVLGAGTQTLKVSFTPTDTIDYTASTGTVQIQVNQATPVITWANPAGITYGTTLSATQLNATATPTGGTFTYTPALGTTLTVGAQTLQVSYVPKDTADYTGATAQVSITVSQAASTVTWSNPAAITYGTALSATQLNATSLVPGTFTYTPAAGTILTAGPHTLKVSFSPTDTADYAASASTAQIQVNQATPIISWNAPGAITYGTKLGASQLNATASTAGTLTYTPVAGTVLGAGTQTLKVSFAPTDTVDYTTATGSVQIQVNQATPVITWSNPAAISYGTELSATQLDATATPAGGTFTYTPPAGTTLPLGSQTLRVSYVPTDATDYTSASASVSIQVNPGLALLSIQPSSANYGAPSTTITLKGTGFTPNSVVQINGTTITSSYFNPTQMTAVIPASFFQQTQPGAITVTIPNAELTSPALMFTITLPSIQINFTGPGSESPGQQPSLNLEFLEGYPQPLQVTLTLTVQPATAGGPVDPAVQFSTGGTTLSFTQPANSTTTPAIQIQTGTLAATITVTLTLESGGQDVTPSGLQPVVIEVPATAPVITGVTLTRSGSTLTVTVQGYSSTRDMSSAVFNFTAASGDTINTPELTVDLGTEFSTWYAEANSIQFGSAFAYTQTFDVSNDASNIGSVSVTLSNSVGSSNTVSAN